MKIRPNQILPLYDYPRPQFERSSYFCLNGFWKYAISKSEHHLEKMDGDILVPYSPESKLSHVNRQLNNGEFLHYCRYFLLPENFLIDRVLLNIGAIDQRCKIYINNHFVAQWNYGYIPISIDITKYLLKNENNEIYIVVYDDADSKIYATGKQCYKRGKNLYTAISGIYQTVFLESTPKDYLRGIKITPDLDSKSINFDFDCVGNIYNIKLEIFENEHLITSLISKYGESIKYVFKNGVHPWTPDDPFLYDVKITYLKDEICSYFAMRKISTSMIDDKYYFMLNNTPILIKGIIYQGIFSDGLYTPSRYNEYERDLKLVKVMGFNTIRIISKIEPMRFYYLCDKMGIVVFQDFISGGSNTIYHHLRKFLNFNIDDLEYKKLGRENEKSRVQFNKEMNLTIANLYNVPSICLWTIFDEGKGQFDSEQTYNVVKNLDSTRLIDAASGWFDQGVGDCNSKHVLGKTIYLTNDNKRVLFLSKCGGYALKIKEHCFSNKCYGSKIVYSNKELTESIYNLFVTDLKRVILRQGLSGFVYSQLVDVEDELTGVITFDRNIIKADIDLIKDANDILDNVFKKHLYFDNHEQQNLK